jgi:hypothetical protein
VPLLSLNLGNSSTTIHYKGFRGSVSGGIRADVTKPDREGLTWWRESLCFLWLRDLPGSFVAILGATIVQAQESDLR